MHSFFWYSSLLITDSSKAGSCRQTSMLAEPGTRECTRGLRRDRRLTTKGPCGAPERLACLRIEQISHHRS